MRKKNIIIALVFISVLCSFYNCKKDENKDEKQIVTEIEGLAIDSIVTSRSSIKAFTDTANITVYATGDNLSFSWEADHGTLSGEGESVIYFAGQCCVGLNTITCTVANDTVEVQDTIKVNVTSYID